MNEEKFCVNCVRCVETPNRKFYCQFYLKFVSGRHTCKRFKFYPQIVMP